MKRFESRYLRWINKKRDITLRLLARRARPFANARQLSLNLKPSSATCTTCLVDKPVGKMANATICHACLSARRYAAVMKDEVLRIARRKQEYRWRANNRDSYRETMRMVTHKRRSALGGWISVADWNKIKNDYLNMCVACLKKKPLTVDHIVPVCLGGGNSSR